ALQAYLASISFADAQIGRVLDALRNSPHAKNTIIVLWSDHGWHHGEKNHWHKWTLWEDATNIPFIVAGPMVKQAGVSTDVPVSTLSLYPTLIDLCQLPKPKQILDETSLAPLLKNPQAKWKEAIVIQRDKGECAVRTNTHRYIRYANGDEELYDHTNDPHEWNNLANQPASKPIITAMQKHVSKDWRNAVPSKGSFKFDPVKYTFTPKALKKK
ncbi:MAG: sulfatase-like hydrolase/transferase, partial [Akkermansiaceae bacterium]